MDTLPSFSAICLKGDNFRDFLLLKKKKTKQKTIAPMGANSLRVDP